MVKQMPDLSGFTGTQAYHKLSLGPLKFTDGWKHLAQEAGAFWLADIMASVQHLPKIREQSFIIWRIVVKDQNAIVTAHYDCESDGSYKDSKMLYKQIIGYTDFPETFEWYQEGNVVLLKQEH